MNPHKVAGPGWQARKAPVDGAKVMGIGEG